MTKEFLHRIKRKLMKMRLQPIRVFCLHHVCAKYDPESMNACDWMQIDEFKAKVQSMQQDGLEFISLKDAYRHICTDWIRCRKYAVLTFDDGYASLKEILPWLNEQHIPTTLFINGKYLDGKSYRKNPKEKYLTKDELWALTSPLIAIGSHGWVHMYASKMSGDEFQETVMRNNELLVSHPCYIPFYAYAYGNHTRISDSIIFGYGLVPIYIDGMKNYNEPNVIHRELL